MAGAAERILAFQHNHNIQRFVENIRERMRRVESKRRQHRHDFVAEISAQPAGLTRVPVLAMQHAHADFAQRRTQHFIPAAVLRIHQFRGAVVDALEQYRVRHAVGSQRNAEVLRLTHGRGADLEEFVQIGAGDTQVLQPLQHRHRTILRLRQHPEIEVELRQFAIEIQRGVAQRIGVLMQLGYCRALCRRACWLMC